MQQHSYTLHDFEYKLKRNKLIRVICKHCQKQVGFSIPKGKSIQDVLVHAAHDCVDYHVTVPTTSNVGVYFMDLIEREDILPKDSKRRAKISLKSIKSKLALWIKRIS